MSSTSQNKSSIPINITAPTTSTLQSALSSSPTPQSSASSSFKNVLFHELQVTISSAKLASKESSPTKHPDVYVELNVDDSPLHKTECLKSTYSPRWDTQFTILITPYSKLTFKVFTRTQNGTKDNLLGDNSINLFDTLKRLNGKIDNLSMPLILDKIKNLDCETDTRDAVTTISRLTIEEQSDECLIDVNKPNYLFIKLTGLEIDMSQYPSRSASPNVISTTTSSAASSSATTTVVDGHEKSKKSSEKHSTRSLPRLFRGNKNSNSLNNNSSSSTTVAKNNSSPINPTTEHTPEHQGENVTNGFQSTLPRWSLNDPNSTTANSTSNTNSNSISPYPKQQPTTIPLTQATNSTVQYPSPSAQYPFPVQGNQANQAQTTFTITNNSTQVQPATITTTEFHDEVLPSGMFLLAV